MDLAERLGCSCDDLITHKVDCPEDKLGKIIGKNGMNIKQLEDKSGCVIDIDKVHHQIHIQGNDVAIMSVVNEIETIIRSTTEDIKIDPATYSYLTCKVSFTLIFSNALNRLESSKYFVANGWIEPSGANSSRCAF
jgi:predicted PilT family ATPase